MKDILTWDCYDGCDCQEQGHVHYANSNKL